MLDEAAVDKLRDEYEQSWRASDSLLSSLDNIMETYQPKRILETGPGISTFVLLNRLQYDPEGVYVGIDHKGDFADRHWARLSRHTGDMKCLVNHGILDLARSDGFYEFTTEGGTDRLIRFLPEQFKADLVVLDGPDSGEARASARAWEFYKTIASKEAIWVIDDTHRRDELMLSELIKTAWMKNECQSYRIFDLIYPHRHSTVLIPDRVFMFLPIEEAVDD